MACIPSDDTTVKVPIQVNLIGQDGNAFMILGLMNKALKQAVREGLTTQEVVNEFTEEATSGNYDHLLATCMEYVEVT